MNKIHIRSISQFVIAFLLIFTSIHVSSGSLVELNDRNFDKTVCIIVNKTIIIL